ncbi:hypothetical protein FBEOM_8518 [Fusarium beomiforme]|uniref:Uncharacterized protein n=1 Tax=Fusarium beomiforme TaxID=44412 RepID=A0A9P5DWS3_9HYPO|nr:hypothetical protein FBEOM_8518 [Fusarium beomiforme]
MESFLGLDLTRNYSFFTVPAAFFVITFPHAYTITAGAKGTYDNCNPRSHKDRITNCQTLDKSHKQFLLRAKAATENGFETIGLYASGIVAANFTGVPTPQINILGLGYVVSRLVYNIAYLWLQDNPRLSRLKITSADFIRGSSLIVLALSLTMPDNPEACDTDSPAVTAAPKESFDCDYSYCGEDDILWCFQFIPFTTIDPTLGPLPGETRVSIGMCGLKTTQSNPVD